MNIEMKPLEIITTDNGIIGHITLKTVAIPKTVRVSLLGKPFKPASFDYFGHPIFTEEQVKFYKAKEKELQIQNGGEYTPLKVRIIYTPQFCGVPDGAYDPDVGGH